MFEMKLAVLGAAGRMGQTLARAIAATEGCVLAAGIVAKGSPAVGRDLGEVAGLGTLGIPITDDAIIPLKERVVDEFYDPITRLLKMFRGPKQA